MSQHLKPWMFVGVWLLLAAGLVLAYAANQISGGTLAFLALCLVMLGIVAIVFWRKLAEPPTSIEELLYEQDKTGRP
jgi:hypothetical protein